MGIELNTEQILAVYKCENWFKHGSQQVFEIAGSAGTGKAQPVDTIIPTPNGPRKLGDLKVGDCVYNRQGYPVKVLGTYDQGFLNTYRVVLSDGRSTCCNNEHLWTVLSDNKLETMTLQQIIDKQENGKNFYVPMNGPISSFDNDSISDISKYAYTEGCKFEYNETILSDCLNKTIEYRTEFIHGLFDTYAIIHSYSHLPMIVHASKRLLNLIRQILFTIGYDSLLVPWNRRGGVILFKLLVIGSAKKLQQLFLYNKNNISGTLLAKPINGFKDDFVMIEKIENLNYKTEMRCIYVDDPEHLYLTNDYIVTHNTTIVLYLMERLGLDPDEVLFLAYQGKAACRLTMTGVTAQTIHSAIYKFEKEATVDDNGLYIRNENGDVIKHGVFRKRDSIGGIRNIKLIVIDEAGMVNDTIAEDVKSFGIPIIVLGDLNQLPPVFGSPYFLKTPDVTLTKVMRQNENNPIVYLSQQVLAGNNLNIGIYGSSEIISRKDLELNHLSKSDIVLVETNRTRWNINNIFRQKIRQYKQLDYPHIGEKVICRKNNWHRSVDNNIFLTNGMCGYVDYIDKSSYNSKSKTMLMDFRPDFTQSVFKDVKFDYNALYTPPASMIDDTDDASKRKKFINYTDDKFEFAYAITVHLSQGSQYKKVLYLNENIMRTKEDQKKLTYTAITRAIDSIIVAI